MNTTSPPANKNEAYNLIVTLSHAIETWHKEHGGVVFVIVKDDAIIKIMSEMKPINK